MSVSKVFKFSFIFAMLLIVVAIVVGYIGLSASKPQLNGTVNIPGLKSEVSVSRDANGIPTIVAKSRSDLARALGYLHGQERFFQMDLLRRNSAGELSELFGESALKHDKKIRLHQFRMRASKSIQATSPKHRAIYQAYAVGVNEGLQQLDSKPFEYSLLGKEPQPWKPEDTQLTVFSMYLDLQEDDGKRERSLTLMRDHLPADLFAFIHPKGSQWDAPIDGSIRAAAPIPKSTWPSTPASQKLTRVEPDMQPEDLMPGSNNWAVSGELTPYKSGMLADDMHLGIRVPIIWYRAHMKWQENGQSHEVVGVTLPGTPNLVVGSNTNVAWGFTNSYGDWSDVIRLRLNEDGSQYLTKDGFKPFDVSNEAILVSDAAPVVLDVKSTIWGPVIAEDADGNPLVYRWVAHDSAAININFLNLEKATSAKEAIAIAATLGMPAQNMVAADSQGNIGWGLTGIIPIRHGFDGSFISDWSDGTQGWSGYQPTSQYPHIVNPEQQRIWTANSRVIGGDMYNIVGDGGYALGARAKQIRDNLFAKEQFAEQDLLDIQLDDRAVFLSRWHQFMLDSVVSQSQHPDKTTLLQELQNWSGKAHKDDLGYLLVRQFRLKVRSLILKIWLINSRLKMRTLSLDRYAVMQRNPSGNWFPNNLSILYLMVMHLGMSY